MIAEIGFLHDCSFGNAMKLIDLASECGANAVKFQTHIADFETLLMHPTPVISHQNQDLNTLKEITWLF